jgi:TatD DNase family protein
VTLVDSHCHLDFPELRSDLAGVLARAKAAGIGTMLTISTKLSEFEGVRSLAEQHAEVWCSVGVHPHEAAVEEGADDTERLVSLARHPRVVGIGESGLDFYYEHSPRQAQARSFRAHAAAARKTGLPLIVHTRDADEETMRILEEQAGGASLKGVIHCFTGGAELAKFAVRSGFMISVSGIVTFKGAQALRTVIREVPLESLIVETDSPYLAPVPMRGKRNEPAYVQHTAAILAELKGVSTETLARCTTENFFRLFSKARPPAQESAGTKA